MPRHGKITIWETMFSGVATFRRRMILASRDQSELDQFMRRYKGKVLSYLQWLWPQYDMDRQPPSPEILARIWDQMMKTLPGKLTPSWIAKNEPFRPLLQDAVHDAALAGQHPHRSEAAVAGRINSDAKPEDDLMQVRLAILGRAKDRLEMFQQTHAEDKCKYFTVFSVWDDDHEQSYEAMKAQLDPMRGCKMSPNTLAKTLERARAKFGRYLGEDLGEWLAETGPINAVRYYDAFTNLDLMEYAYWSPYCLSVMGIDQKFLKQTIN